jgi:hypothetical protein
MTVRVGRLTSGMTAEDHRLASGIFMSPATALSARGGCVPGGLRLSAGSPMSARISPGQAWIEGGNTASQGGYAVTVDSDTEVVFTNGHASLGRVDLIVLRVRDHAYDASGTTGGSLEVVVGTPAATPTPPATPKNAEALYEVSVPAGTSAGSGGINWATAPEPRHRYTTALGGILPAAGDDAGVYPGQYRDRAGLLERWNGSA